ncbi:MAG: PAS domain S-box protein, partial [Ignavibacteria bacterium]|nr:PAS domain S-box protein [Ignavibacteria bacterium]
MSHKRKISSSRDLFSIFMLVVLFLAVMVFGYVLFSGIRINFIYSDLIDSAVRMKTDVAKSRISFLEYSSTKDTTSLKKMWEYLDIIEFNSKYLLEKKEHLNIFPITESSSYLNEQIQKLQIDLFAFRGLSSDMIALDSLSSANLNAQWKSLYNQVEQSTQLLESYLTNSIKSQLGIFKLTQYALILSILILSFFAFYFYYRSKRIQTDFDQKVKNIRMTAEKGIRKATIAEEELIESQRKLDTLIQNLPGMVYRSKGSDIWSFDFVSDKCVQITGYKATDIINNRTVSYYKLINTEDFKKVFQQVQKAVEEKKPFQLIYRIKTAAGYDKWVWEQGSAIFSDQDELIGLEGFITDITEQKAVEDQSLLQSNALDAAANAILITDSEGRIEWVNKAFTKLTGYTPNEVLGKNPKILKSGQHSSEFYDLLWKTIKAGDTWRAELINKRKDGTLYHEEMIVTPVKNASGVIENFVAIKQDITERKQNEADLRASELRFRGLFENASVGIYRSSPAGKIILANPALLKITGYDSFEELNALDARDLYANPDTRQEFINEIEKKEIILGFESAFVRKDGLIVAIRESSRLYKDEHGRTLYFEGTIEDISDRKLAEKILIEAKEKAEKSDKLKSEFLAQMSHEIRTPLNVILNFSSMIKEELEDKVDEELRDSFNIITEEGKRIMRTVELILNMSELQTGNYNYRANTVDLFDILSKLYSDYLPIAETKNILFGIMNDDNIREIKGDEYSIRQIFLHLIDNAIKYTNAGKVQIVLKREKNSKVLVEIFDTGIGISEEYLGNMFQPFTKEELGYTRNYE